MAARTFPRSSASPASTPVTHIDPPTYEEIAESAYRRYEERGAEPGRDVDDWLDAERDLLDRRAHADRIGGWKIDD